MDSPESTQQETRSEDLNDIIADTFDEMEAAEDELETGDVEEMEVSSETGEEEPAQDAESEEGSEEVEEPDGEEPAQELKEEIEEAAESDYNEPAPERWPEEIKDVYNGLPPAARKAMLEGIYKPMQQSYTQTTQQLAAQRNELAPFVQILDQHRAAFESTGVDPVEVVKSQVAWAAHFQRVGAEQGLNDMRQAYGLGEPQAGQEGKYLTPTERAQQAQIDALQQQINGQQAATQNWRQEQTVAAQKAEINTTLQNFVNEKTEDGKPMHPHVDKVASNIAGIIRGGLVAKADEYGNAIPMRDQLAQAYSMACNLDPAIRTPAINDKRQANRVKAAQKVSVVTKNPANPIRNEELPMTDFIEKTYDQLDGR